MSSIENVTFIPKPPPKKRSRKKGGLPGKKSWVSGTKLAFLVARYNEWRLATQMDRAGQFYTKITKLFILKYDWLFDLHDDLEDDVDDPDEDLLEDFDEEEEGLSEEESERRYEYYLDLRTASAVITSGKQNPNAVLQKIGQWFRYHFRKRGADGNLAELLQNGGDALPKPPKGRRLIHVYSKRYYDTRVLKTFNTEWARVKALPVPPGSKAPTAVNVRNRVTEEVFDRETEDFKEMVRGFKRAEDKANRDAWEKSQVVEEENRTAEDYHAALKHAAFTLQPFADAASNRYGMAVSIILVGPVGELGGSIEVRSVHSGTTRGSVKKTWPQADPNGFTQVANSMLRFGVLAFSQEDCDARALGVPAAPPPPTTSTPAPPAPTASTPVATPTAFAGCSGLSGLSGITSTMTSANAATALSIATPLNNTATDDQTPTADQTPTGEPVLPGESTALSKSTKTRKGWAEKKAEQKAKESKAKKAKNAETAIASAATPTAAPPPGAAAPARPKPKPRTKTTDAEDAARAAGVGAQSSAAGDGADGAQGDGGDGAQGDDGAAGAQGDGADGANADGAQGDGRDGAQGDGADGAQGDDGADGAQAHQEEEEEEEGEPALPPWELRPTARWPQELVKLYEAMEREGLAWGEIWEDLAYAYVSFEEACGFPYDRVQMARKGRVPLVDSWIAGRRPYNYPPAYSGTVADLQDAFWRWWRGLQPEVRMLQDDAMKRPKKLDWGDVRNHAGKNGLGQVVLVLQWWKNILVRNKSKTTPLEVTDWELAVEDVMWALQSLVENGGLTKKRAADRGIHDKDEPQSKVLKRR